jgi:hypothetical protein
MGKVNNKELAEYLCKQIKENSEVLTEDDLEFWIQQFKVKGCVGHSEWSERYQCNFWVKDDE